MRSGAVAFLALIGLSLGSVAWADSAGSFDDQRSEQQSLVASADTRKAEISAAFETTNAQLAAVVKELANTQAKVALATEKLTAAQGKVDGLAREVQILSERQRSAYSESQQVEKEISVSAAKASEIEGALAHMAQAAYKGQDLSEGLVLLLQSESLSEYVQGAAMAQTAARLKAAAIQALEEITAVNRSRHSRLDAIKEQIAQFKAQMDAKLAAAQAARQEALNAKSELEAVQATQQAQSDSLAGYKSQLEAEYAAVDAARAEALRKIASINAAATGGSAQVGAGGGPYGLSNPTAFAPAIITSPYGNRFHPVLHYWRMHWGTDLSSYCGYPLYAAQAGNVEWGTYLDGYGNQVMLSHGNINGAFVQTSYAHMSEIVVSAGQHVNQGQLIGYAGNTGVSAGCHLHFEVLVNGANVDPMSVVTFPTVDL